MTIIIEPVATSTHPDIAAIYRQLERDTITAGGRAHLTTDENGAPQAWLRNSRDTDLVLTLVAHEDDVWVVCTQTRPITLAAKITSVGEPVAHARRQVFDLLAAHLIHDSVA